MTKKKVSRTDEIIDELLREYGVSPEAILGRQGLVKDLTKRVVERSVSENLCLEAQPRTTTDDKEESKQDR
jgi:hypothetical protein